MDTAEFHLTDHAIARYIERVRPAADVVCARSDVNRLLAFAVASPKPEWVHATDSAANADRYMVAGNVVFPVTVADNGLVVTTCIVRPPTGAIPWPKHARPAVRSGGRAHARDRRRAIREAKAAA